MEENEVKEEDRQRTTGGEWFDLNKLSDLLCELDAVATQVGNIFWVDYHAKMYLNNVVEEHENCIPLVPWNLQHVISIPKYATD